MGQFAVLRWSILLMLSAAIGGCGLKTPDLYLFEDKQDNEITLNHIVNEVKCELIQGVVSALNYDIEQEKINRTGRKLRWLENWSAKVTLTFDVEEGTALNPGISWNTNYSTIVQRFPTGPVVNVPRSFTLGAGGAFSSNARRIDKIDFFFAFKDFLERPDPNKDLSRPCKHQGSVLIESDLKLKDWIETATFANYTDSITTPQGFKFPMSVISHQVSFVVKAAGNITPTWKLVPVSANTGNLPFFQLLRNSTNDLLITLGSTATKDAVPIEKEKPPEPSQAVINSHLASEIGAAVAAAIRANQ
jgi:predicted small lipoprotein YifL